MSSTTASMINLAPLADCTKSQPSLENTLRSAKKSPSPTRRRARKATGCASSEVTTASTCSARPLPRSQRQAQVPQSTEPVTVVSIRRNDPYAANVIGDLTVTAPIAYGDAAAELQAMQYMLAAQTFQSQPSYDQADSDASTDSVGYNTSTEVTPTKRRRYTSATPSTTQSPLQKFPQVGSFNGRDAVMSWQPSFVSEESTSRNNTTPSTPTTVNGPVLTTTTSASKVTRVYRNGRPVPVRM